LASLEIDIIKLIKNLKILLINTFNQGGAAQACIRLHHGLLNSKINTNLLLKKSTGFVRNSYLCAPKILKRLSFRERLIGKLCKFLYQLEFVRRPRSESDEKWDFLNNRPHSLEFFSFPDSNYDITESPLYREADIIHFHWVADFLDWESFFRKNTKPIVWTLHDQNPFLGGQHYDERYLGVDDRGFPIPRRKTRLELSKESQLLKVKHRALNGNPKIWVVAPSKWLGTSSQNSGLFGRFNHRRISYGVPINVFKPLNRDFCREILGFPKNKIILLFVAESLENSRKGYIYLKKALELLGQQFSDMLILCSIGGKSELEETKFVMELGKIQDERLMAMAYSAADLFIIPSLEDNLPNTMLESLCCGTPVLGFPTGGILETIEDGINGLLCDEISIQALRNSLVKFLSKEFQFDRLFISTKAQEKFSIEKQACGYIKLYNEIMHEKN